MKAIQRHMKGIGIRIIAARRKQEHEDYSEVALGHDHRFRRSADCFATRSTFSDCACPEWDFPRLSPGKNRSLFPVTSILGSRDSPTQIFPAQVTSFDLLLVASWMSRRPHSRMLNSSAATKSRFHGAAGALQATRGQNRYVPTLVTGGQFNQLSTFFDVVASSKCASG